MRTAPCSGCRGFAKLRQHPGRWPTLRDGPDLGEPAGALFQRPLHHRPGTSPRLPPVCGRAPPMASGLAVGPSARPAAARCRGAWPISRPPSPPRKAAAPCVCAGECSSGGSPVLFFNYTQLVLHQIPQVFFGAFYRCLAGSHPVRH